MKNIGQVELPYREIEQLKRYGFFGNIFRSLFSLISGMGITLKYFVNPAKTVTRQYPENRATLTLTPRARMELAFAYDDKNYHKCTSCKLCEKACPNFSIMVMTRQGPVSGRKELHHYVWRLDTCTFCNACTLVCPTGAIEMNTRFENSVYDRRMLIYCLNNYSGPPGPVIEKEEDEAKRKAMQEPHKPYEFPAILKELNLPGITDAVLSGGDAVNP